MWLLDYQYSKVATSLPIVPKNAFITGTYFSIEKILFDLISRLIFSLCSIGNLQGGYSFNINTLFPSKLYSDVPSSRYKNVSPISFITTGVPTEILSTTC